VEKNLKRISNIEQGILNFEGVNLSGFPACAENDGCEGRDDGVELLNFELSALSFYDLTNDYVMDVISVIIVMNALNAPNAHNKINLPR